MSRSLRLLVVCIGCGLIGLVGWPAGAWAQPVSSAGSSSLFDSSLVVPAGESLLGGEQRQAAREARLASPEAVRKREESQTAYEGLSASGARELADRAFPRLIDESDGGLPRLPEGERMSKIVGANTAQVVLSGGRRGVIESLGPIAARSPLGGWVPIDLGLEESGGGFQPKAPAGGVRVRIPKRLGEGADLIDSGVSLTPVVDVHGASLEGASGVIDGASVFYGRSEDARGGVRDVSMLAKPMVGGFEWFDVLLSARSPEHLFFKVGLPSGARLVEDPSGSVRVLREGVALAVLPRPWAVDAAGTPIEVSVGVVGDVVELSLPVGGAVRYPVLLDPSVEDRTIPTSSNPYGSNWNFVSEPPGQFKFFGSEESGSATAAGQHMELLYKTRGESKIYRLELNSYSEVLHARSTLEIVKNGGSAEESGELLGNNVSYVHNESSLCAKKDEVPPSCATSTETNGNFVRFQQTANEAYTNMWSSIASADVYISQEKPPTATFNEKDAKIRIEEPNGMVVERENVLYPGSKGWVGPHSSTAFETIDKDPGVGLSFVAADGGTWSREVFLKEKEGKCSGVQCPEEYKGKFTYYTTTPEFTKPMPSGEYQIQSYAEDSVKLNGFSYATVRVDAEAPQSIKLVGLPAGNQFGEGVYKIKAEATDGKTGVPSSGVQSLKLGIDGAEAGEPHGSCSRGPCTASAEWTINGGQLSAGAHVLTVVATDNAGNVSHEDFVIFIHHATPVALGPGSLDPQSGNFSLGASDVSMGPGLTLMRTYSSRDLTAGVEGGLGPQWAISVDSSESLEELADGSMVLTAAGGGGETTFQRNSKGELESPKGDANVALSEQTNEKGVPTAYFLKDAATGTTTKFARAEGYLQTAPDYYGEIGWQGPGTGQLNTPMGVASDAKGDAWVADTKNDRIEKFDTQGEYASQFGSEGSGNGALSEPRGVAIDTKSNIWVADTGNNRIEKFNEKGEYALQAGVEGLGALKAPQGITVDLSGNVWVADTGDNRVVEFNEKGEYVREASKTVGSLALSEPVGVATDASANVWVTDAKNHRFVEFSSTGSALKEYGVQGSGNGQFETPSGIAIDVEGDVYVADYAEDRIQEFGAKGEYLTKFGSAGANGGQMNKPYLMAIDARGALLVADSENSRVERWAHAAWLPAISEGLVATSKVSYTYKAVRSATGTEIEPTEVLAPHTSELSCAPELKAGCRALTFNYAKETTAIGESPSEWGEYAGRLSKIVFHGYNPSSKAMEEKPVAEYSFDKQGRLRAEWDPRISPALKTTYGYDSEQHVAEDHVTAASPPHQQPWLITYGSSASDTSGGRVIKVLRPSASTKIWTGSAPEDRKTELVCGGIDCHPVVKEYPPILSGSPAVGVRMATTLGTWTGEPPAYGFQWEECNPTGGECKPIAGATNQNYTPTSSVVGHTLRARVTATNATGSNAATSAASGAVTTGTGSEGEAHGAQPGSTIEYRVPVSGGGQPQNLGKEEVEKWGQNDDPVEGTAVFPPDRPMGWPATEYTSATISYFDAQGRTVNVANASGGISTSEYNETNNVVRTLSADKRALALKEGAKSAEAAGKLDSRRVYNEEGDELLETLGPEHKVKLPNGSEAQARHIVKYSYDEGAPEGGPYRLVTKSTDAAILAGKEENIKTTVTSYSGQNNLGWTLRKPTSVTTDPSGLKLAHTTIYDPTTGNVLETRGPADHGEKPAITATYVSQSGSAGSGNGQFKEPVCDAVDSKGDVWVVDSANNRVQEFSSAGAYLNQFGSVGTGNGQFKEPKCVAVDASGNLWVTDAGNDRVQEFSSSREYLAKFGSGGTGNGQFLLPKGIAVDAAGHVWVVDQGNNRVQEFSSTGEYLGQFGSAGTGNGQFKEPLGVAVDAAAHLWVVDWGNNRVQEFSSTGEYLGQFGSAGTGNGQFKGPWSIAVDAAGDLWVADQSNQRVQEFTSHGEYITKFGTTGTGEGQFKEPRGVTVDTNGNIWVTDAVNNRVEKWHATSVYAYVSQSGSAGTGNGQFKEPVCDAGDSTGDVWVVDSVNNRVQELSPVGAYLSQFGSAGTGNGQFKSPKCVAVDGSGNLWVTDSGNNRVQEFSSSGAYLRQFGSAGTGNGQFKLPKGVTVDAAGHVWVADQGNNRVQEFSSTGEYLGQFGSAGTGNGQFKEPLGVAVDAAAHVWVADWGNNRVQEFSSTGEYLGQFGSAGTGNGQFKSPWSIAVDAAGDLWVADQSNQRVQEFTSHGEYITKFGTTGTGEGQFKEPRGVTVDTNGNIWVTDAVNNRVEKWVPAGPNPGARHDTQTIYYTAAANTKYATCGGHPEWANLPCQTQPAAQPEGSAAPPLPVSTVGSYNMWGEPETSTETFGSTTRTKKLTYDEAGRALSSEETSTSTEDKALPKVTDEYDSKTGQLVKQSTTAGEETQTITSAYDTLGRLTSYTDADKNITTYEYEESGDGRLTSVSDAKGTQTYAYDPTTGELTKLLDTAAKTLTASYDVEGNMTSETYPNGMTAAYTRDQAGETTAIEYVKTTDCTEKCVWFSEASVPSIHGETVARSSTLTSDSYIYDTVGRLTQTTETPAGKGCTTRVYAYDEDSNRTSLTTRAPGIEGKCASEGGTSETHSYDSADRLIDTGVSYDPLGNTTKLPAADAGGHELSSGYYVDGQVQKQSQNGQTNTYSIDPAGRVRKTVGEGTTNLTTINHYGGSGEALTWKDEGSGKYTRLIAGIDGTLYATETNGAAPVLQIHDLQGDIVATAALSETETKLLTTYESTEFGVPVNGTPPTKYSWLGAAGVSSELSSGTLISGTVAYQPQLGRTLQTEAVVPPGMAVNGAAGVAYVSQVSAWEIASGNEAAHKHAEEGAAEERAAEREAEEKILQQCREEGGCGAPSMCDEETEGCGPDPEKGDNTHKCKVWASWGGVIFGTDQFLTVYGHFECGYAVYGFELQIALQLVESGGVEGGQYLTVDEPVKKVFGNKGKLVSEGVLTKDFQCTPGRMYRAWVFGRFWYKNKYTPWSATALDGRLMECIKVDVELPPGQ